MTKSGAGLAAKNPLTLGMRSASPPSALTSTASPDAILAAVAADAALPDVLLARAAAAFRVARDGCTGAERQAAGGLKPDWEIVDGEWKRFGSIFGAHLRVDVYSLPPAVQREMTVRRIRALLEASEFFEAWRPVPSGYHPLGPVLPVVVAARVAGQVHRLEPMRVLIGEAA